MSISCVCRRIDHDGKEIGIHTAESGHREFVLGNYIEKLVYVAVKFLYSLLIVIHSFTGMPGEQAQVAGIYIIIWAR